MLIDKYLLQEIFEEFSDSPFFDFESYCIDYNDVALDFLKFLILSTLVGTDQIEIGTFYEVSKNIKVGAQISYDIYNPDKSLDLNLSGNSVFEIVLSYYDDDFGNGDYRKYSYVLNKEELKILPEGLVNLMKQVQSEDKPKTFHVNNL